MICWKSALIGIVTVCIHIMIAIILLMLLMIVRLGGGNRTDYHTINLSCTMDSVKEPAIYDTTDDVCYAIEVCNQFSLLPIEHGSILESTVKEMFGTSADNHSTKSMDAPIPSISCESLQGSSEDGDHS